MRALWRQVPLGRLKHVSYALITLCASWLAGMTVMLSGGTAALERRAPPTRANGDHRQGLVRSLALAKRILQVQLTSAAAQVRSNSGFG